MINLRGADGWQAYQVYLALSYYIPVMPTFEKCKTRDDAFNEFKSMSEDERKKVLIELMSIAPVSDSDLYKLLSVQRTDDGKAFSPPVVRALQLGELMKRSLDALFECSEVDSSLFF